MRFANCSRPYRRRCPTTLRRNRVPVSVWIAGSEGRSGQCVHRRLLRWLPKKDGNRIWVDATSLIDGSMRSVQGKRIGSVLSEDRCRPGAMTLRPRSKGAIFLPGNELRKKRVVTRFPVRCEPAVFDTQCRFQVEFQFDSVSVDQGVDGLSAHA